MKIITLTKYGSEKKPIKINPKHIVYYEEKEFACYVVGQKEIQRSIRVEVKLIGVDGTITVNETIQEIDDLMFNLG